MNSPINEINKILSEIQTLPIEEGLKYLYTKYGILSKDHPDHNLVVLYQKFDTPCSSNIQRVSRSFVMTHDYKLVSYSCPIPYENMEYISAHQNDNMKVFECFEGTLLSLFCYNDIWYLSTRRCLDANESKLNSGTMTHREMFNSIVGNFDNFVTKLNKTNVYNFVLVHHENKHIIDYTNHFGPNYAKLVVVSVRDSNMNEITTEQFTDDFIVIPQELDTYNISTDVFSEPTSEGVIIKMNGYITKLQHSNYRFFNAMGLNKNIYSGFIFLYQQGYLSSFIQENSQYKSINNQKQHYDTIGAVDAVFKTITTELFELFKVLWSIKTGKQQDKELYELMPKEYKDILFGIRGIYYKKKADYINAVSENQQTKPNYMTKNDIYNWLKTLRTETLVSFLRMRFMMYNWIQTESRLVIFSHCSDQVLTIHKNIIDVYTRCLYPELKTTDIPV